MSQQSKCCPYLVTGQGSAPHGPPEELPCGPGESPLLGACHVEATDNTPSLRASPSCHPSSQAQFPGDRGEDPREGEGGEGAVRELPSSPTRPMQVPRPAVRPDRTRLWMRCAVGIRKGLCTQASSGGLTERAWRPWLERKKGFPCTHPGDLVASQYRLRYPEVALGGRHHLGFAFLGHSALSLGCPLGRSPGVGAPRPSASATKFSFHL